MIDDVAIKMLSEINKKIDRLQREPEEILDTTDVCRLLKISKRSVATLKQMGKLPYYTLAGKHYYKFSEITAILFKEEPSFTLTK